jgi:endo-1,4-beta-xylanase
MFDFRRRVAAKPSHVEPNQRARRLGTSLVLRAGAGALCVVAALSCIKREWRNAEGPAEGAAVAAAPTTASVQTPGVQAPDKPTGNYGKVQGVDVLGGKGVRAFAVQGKVERIDAKWFPAEGQSFAEYIQVQGKQGPGGAVQPWDVQLRASNSTAVEVGDVMLATIYFRTKWIGDEYGEGQSEFVFEVARDPWTKSTTFELRAGPEWKQILVPFVAAGSYGPGEAQLAFRLGYSTKQTIEFGGITLENFGKQLALADLPKSKLTYPGMEPNAAWRAEAEARIEQHRKGNFEVLVQDANGKPVSGASVAANMTKSAFGWGTCVPAESIVANDQKLLTPIKQLFNMATLENDLKWEPLAGDWGGSFTMDRALAGVDWLNKNGLDVRGHVMVWPGWNELPRYVKKLKDDKKALRAEVAKHIREMGNATKGKVVHWDVLNEPFTNHDLMEILGYDVMAEWFRIAREVEPKAKLYINDFGILPGGGGTNEHRDHYEKMIQILADAKAPFDGIAFQGHIGSSMTGPEDLKRLLDRYGKFGKDLMVTEYDITIDDEELAASYMRDFYTMLFSHPQMKAIVMWGIWDGNHWRKNAPLFHKDWSPKPAFEVYKHLTQEQWATHAKGNSAANGTYALRGFYGDYEVTVTHAGKTQKATAKWRQDGDKVVVKLP